MVDRLLLYSAKSIAVWIGDNVDGLDAAYVAGPDFDYDRKPDPTNPRDRIPRDLPFIAVTIIGDQQIPFSMSSGFLYTHDMDFEIGVYGTGISSLTNLTTDVKQAIKDAFHPVSGKPGIPLYDFATPSGAFYDLVNAVNVEEIGNSLFFGPDDTADQGNRKYKSMTTLSLTAFKDRSTRLLGQTDNYPIFE